MMPDPPVEPNAPPDQNDPWPIDQQSAHAQSWPYEKRAALLRWAMMGGIALCLLVAGAFFGLWIHDLSSVIAVSDKPTSTPTVDATLSATAALPQTLVPFPTTTRIVSVTPPKPRTSTPRPKTGATATPFRHKVGAGDTLASIAQQYGVTVKAIMDANGLKTQTLRAGQTLIIPLASR